MVVLFCAAERATNDSWADFRGHSYRYITDGSVSARQASHECAALGALLVSINSELENEFIVREVLRGNTLSAFIGGTDADDGKHAQ